MESIWHRFVSLLSADLKSFLPSSGISLRKDVLLRLLIYIAFISFVFILFYPQSFKIDKMREFFPYMNLNPKQQEDTVPAVPNGKSYKQPHIPQKKDPFIKERSDEVI